MKVINKEFIKESVKEKLISACRKYYDAELSLCEICAPQSWIDDRKKAYDEFIWRCQDYIAVFEDIRDITYDDLNYDDYM